MVTTAAAPKIRIGGGSSLAALRGGCRRVLSPWRTRKMSGSECGFSGWAGSGAPSVPAWGLPVLPPLPLPPLPWAVVPTRAAGLSGVVPRLRRVSGALGPGPGVSAGRGRGGSLGVWASVRPRAPLVLREEPALGWGRVGTEPNRTQPKAQPACRLPESLSRPLEKNKNKKLCPTVGELKIALPHHPTASFSKSE